MACFSNQQEVYEHLGGLMTEVLGDESLGLRFRRAGTVLRQEFTHPEAVITVALRGEPGEDAVFFGDDGPDPDVTMRMDADVAHRFWLGEVNVGIALARGEMEATGPIDKILRLVPLTPTVFPVYRTRLSSAGRSDLLDGPKGRAA